MAESYDMRSNIKGKPGSQGTLFQVKDKGLLNPQQRWPQGYTPERLHEVREGLKGVPVQGPQHFYDQPSHETQQQHGFNEFGVREHVTREIAKTTVPGEHLQRLTGINGDPNEGHHGTYRKGMGQREISVDMTGQTGETDRNDQRKTLVHEIGHHVNMTLAPTPHVHDLVARLHATVEATDRYEAGKQGHWEPTQTDIAMKRSTVAKNVDEAQADDYAVEHFRTGGRKSKGTTTGAYEDTFTAHERKKHYPGYNDVRPPQDPERTYADHALQSAQFQPSLFPAQGGNRQTELMRRLRAQSDATQHAIGENLK